MILITEILKYWWSISSVGVACDHDIVARVEEGAEGVQESLHVGHQVITKIKTDDQ